MADLADAWAQQRQTCVNILCGYLRMPYEPEPASDVPREMPVAFCIASGVNTLSHGRRSKNGVIVTRTKRGNCLL
jgi:hypothetical protein